MELLIVPGDEGFFRRDRVEDLAAEQGVTGAAPSKIGGAERAGRVGDHLGVAVGRDVDQRRVAIGAVMVRRR